MSSVQYLFSIPSDTAFLSALELFFGAFFEKNALSEMFDYDEIFLCLVEATVNAIKHGNKYDLEKNADIILTIADESLIIIIEDKGDGFSEDQVKDPTSPEQLIVPNGRGVYLMKRLMDSVSYNFAVDGTRLTMIKYAGKLKGG